MLRPRKTRFVEIFRTTPVNTVCPNFFVLQHAGGCTFAPQCSYCYLKSSFWYLARPQAFSNVKAMLADVRRWIRRDKLESFILNMGNLSDSLAFEAQRPVLPELVRVFREEAEKRGRPHSLLLVTKGGLRDSRTLLAQPACRNVIVSFSVNTPAAARQYEAGAAPVADRLRAARRLKDAGWRIRIRIDPMIAGFNYDSIAGEVRRLGPERVTLGSLRAEHSLPRFAGKKLFAALEKPSSQRGLARYPLRQRLALYRSAVRKLRGLCPLGLCEETPDVWRALGLDTEAKSCNCGE
jgi:spore photoproduct lyase